MDKLELLRQKNPILAGLYEDCIDLILAKNADYAGTGDFYRNLRASEVWGLPGWKSVLVRLSDKISRLYTFAQRGDFHVKDESFYDTCKDTANYVLLMAAMYLEDKLTIKMEDLHRIVEEKTRQQDEETLKCSECRGDNQ